MASMEAGTNRVNFGDPRPRSEVKSGLHPFIEGDVLMAKITPSMENGKTAVVRGMTSPLGFGSTEFHVLRCHDELLPEYLYYWLYRDTFRAEAKRNMKGTAGQLRVPATWLEQTPIVLAPLDVQATLVQEFEEEFSKVDAAGELLERSAVRLRRYQRAFLRQVCEPWPRAPLREICSVHIGATPSRKVSSFWGGNIPWVVSKDLHARRVWTTEERITEEGLAKTSTQLHEPGTVLLGTIGQGPTRGMSAILEIEACTSQNLAALRPKDRDQLSPEWLMHVLDSQYQELRSLGSGNNQKALNKTVVESVEIPLPPVERQRELVVEIDRQLTMATKTNEVVELGSRRAASLKQAMLAAGFSGNLIVDSSKPGGSTKVAV